MIRTGVKPQDKVVEKGFRRIEQNLEEIEKSQYTPKKDLIPGNDVNLGSEKKRFNKIYTKELITDGSTIKLGDIELKQSGKGDKATVQIVNSRTNNNALQTPALQLNSSITAPSNIDGGGKHLFLTTSEDDGMLVEDTLTIEDGNTLEFISL